MSGFVRPSRVGPRALKHAMSPSTLGSDGPHDDAALPCPELASVQSNFVVNAPTEITFLAVAGVSIVFCESPGIQRASARVPNVMSWAQASKVPLPNV